MAMQRDVEFARPDTLTTASPRAEMARWTKVVKIAGISLN